MLNIGDLPTSNNGVFALLYPLNATAHEDQVLKQADDVYQQCLSKRESVLYVILKCLQRSGRHLEAAHFYDWNCYEKEFFYSVNDAHDGLLATFANKGALPHCQFSSFIFIYQRRRSDQLKMIG